MGDDRLHTVRATITYPGEMRGRKGGREGGREGDAEADAYLTPLSSSCVRIGHVQQVLDLLVVAEFVLAIATIVQVRLLSSPSLPPSLPPFLPPSLYHRVQARLTLLSSPLLSSLPPSLPPPLLLSTGTPFTPSGSGRPWAFSA